MGNYYSIHYKNLIILVYLTTLLIWGASLGAPKSIAGETEETLRIGTLDLQPYGCKDRSGNKHGILYQLHQELGKRTGLPFTNEIIPIARILDMLDNGELDLITAQPHTSALAAGHPLIIQNPISVIVVTRKNSGIETKEDLQGRRLLYILKASYPTLEEIPKRITRVKNYEIMLNMINTRSSIDGGVFSEPAFFYWMKQLNLSFADIGNIIHISTRNDWVFVRKDLSESLHKTIRKAVQSMRQDRYYDHLMRDIKIGAIRCP